MLKIGEFSKLAQISPKTLRLYDERGLLKPAWIDRWTGYRYYYVTQLAELNRILAFKDLGFSLEQIAALLQDDPSAAELRGMIRLKRAQVEQHIQEEQARLARIETRLQLSEEEAHQPAYEVVLKRVPPLRVAGIREQVPYLEGVPSLLDELYSHLGARGITQQPAAPPLAVYYDAVFRETGLDMEVALPLQRRIRGDQRVQVHELPGVETMACVLHHGSYNELGDAYQALIRWVDTSGYQIDGPNRDLYLQRPAAAGHGDTVTEVQFPIKPKPFLSIVPSYKEHKKMEVKIITKPAFSVAGLDYYGKNEHGEIPQLWEVLNPRYKEINGRSEPEVAFGICGEMAEDGRFRYLAGFQVEPGSQQPEDMRTWDVPEQTYAVFSCTLQTIHETYHYAFQTWLPQSEYEHVPGPDFELYDEEFDGEKGTGMSIFIPVKKK